MTTVWHPRRDPNGKRVSILQPTKASRPAAWADSGAVVVVPPNGEAPASLNGVPFAPWQPSDDGWAVAEAARWPVAEPAFTCPPGLQPAAGVVVLEDDGRVWLAAPTNGFGGASLVVPKGRVDPGAGLAASALRECWEEVGLRARLTGHLVDLPRTMTFTRYYVGQRVGGDPSCMGWESQGVILSPLARLHELLDGAHDGPLIAAILASCT